MKVIGINSRSWHYRIVYSMRPENRAMPEDLCSYMGCLFGAACFGSILTLLGFLTCYIVGSALAWMAAILVGHFYIDAPAITWGLATVVAVCWLLTKAGEKAVEHAPSFAKEAASALHDKVCYRIDYR